MNGWTVFVETYHYTKMCKQSKWELPMGVARDKAEALSQDRTVTGYFFTHDDPEYKIALMDKGAVRWISKEEWWWLFHDSDHYPKQDQLSNKHLDELNKIKRQYKALLRQLRVLTATIEAEVEPDPEEEPF